MGLRGKRGKDKGNLGWIRSSVGRLYTEDALAKDLLALTPKDRLTIVSNMMPKLNINENNGLDIRIILEGIQGKQAIAGRVMPLPMLAEHDE